MIIYSFQANYVNLGRRGQTLQSRLISNADQLVQYYAVNMEDMDNFKFHLNKILIPRVPGTAGNAIVRQVRS